MWLSSIHKGSRNPMYPFESHCYEFALFSEPILGLFGAQLWNSLCWQSVEYCNNHFRCHPEDVYHRMKTSKLWWISKDPHPPSQPHFPLTSNFLTWGNIWSPDSFSEDITITSSTKKCFRSQKKCKPSLPVMIRTKGGLLVLRLPHLNSHSSHMMLDLTSMSFWDRVRVAVTKIHSSG